MNLNGYVGKKDVLVYICSGPLEGKLGNIREVANLPYQVVEIENEGIFEIKNEYLDIF